MKNIPRWINDTNPQETVKSRIERLLTEIVNRKINGKDSTDWDMLSHVTDELTAIWNKLERETSN